MTPSRNRETKGVQTPASSIQNPPHYGIVVVSNTVQEDTSLSNGLDTFHLFSALPKELQLAIMRLWLVRPNGPIINPFRPHQSYQPTEWIEDINLTVLRTCKEFHKEGIDLFYGHNVFLFTRARLSNQRNKIPLSRIEEFLAPKIQCFEPGSPPQFVTIGTLVQKMGIAETEKPKEEPGSSVQSNVLPPDPEWRLWGKMLQTSVVEINFSSINLAVSSLESLTIYLDVREPMFGTGLQGHLFKLEMHRKAALYRQKKNNEPPLDLKETMVQKLIIYRRNTCRGVQPDDASIEMLRRLLALQRINVKHIRFEN